MFNRTGILCGHGLKVLDFMNIKTLPTHYYLKRWTREARNGSILDRQGRNVVENPKLEAQLRYKNLSHKFHTMAYKVVNSLECCLMLENALDNIGPQLEDKLNATTNTMDKQGSGQENVDPNLQQTNEFLTAAKLKKKEVPSKNLRRKKTWLDKLLKGRRPIQVAASKNRGAKQPKKHDGVESQVGVEKDDNNKGANLEIQGCDAIISYTQLLTDAIYDEHIF
ncbi:protein FAR1-RELATED SEQUENCE 1-like [Brachypodium distachyon]|uniref:protein FAR1-RELATED SEQUENCE 1-like n=1 Tax=Brachypodium distachyon TaxID=15368 RepID=UPI000D0CCBED|nr:protein FAR1-RELATED SEQUENCE 1-like [Brachypodium distachyon]|eukprot:XP_024318049.1 protein FAR1-RELATED SEQUENCE 1-like [Brachypodium distachyon]